MRGCASVQMIGARNVANIIRARIRPAVIDEPGFTGAEQQDLEEEISTMWA